MAKRRAGRRKHAFRDKLLLNQWLISQFGIDPLHSYEEDGEVIRPYDRLSRYLKVPRTEGLGADGLHVFYHNLVNHVLSPFPNAPLTKEMLLGYEMNIVRHTNALNEHRQRPITWKYYQWLTLLFTEVYLDRYFTDREQLLEDLNAYVVRFNQHYEGREPMPAYTLEDLNKVCLQSATGSGKTLVMHANLLQFRRYAKEAGKANGLSRAILITPNESLSRQHMEELDENGIATAWFAQGRNNLLTAEVAGLQRVDIVEITKLAEKDGPTQIATRSLGDQNLLLVDEGHRGLKTAEAGSWVQNRNMLSEKGFTFEYSATFQQAVAGTAMEDDYAKCVLFDYSYRWFYNDGFGKDYRIANISNPQDEELGKVYLTGALLRAFQQHLIYSENRQTCATFNLEKPLWVFVGNSVSGKKKSGQWNSPDEGEMATDVARILLFLADFLADRNAAQRRIGLLLNGAAAHGMIDGAGQDIFRGAFDELLKKRAAGTSDGELYGLVLRGLFNAPGGGELRLERLKGDQGEVALYCGTAQDPFGLIYVGAAKELCDHVEEVASAQGASLQVNASDFSDGLFDKVKESSSKINLLVGSKKFIEGWDCWRVSSLGLMHVGRSEGAQVIQLFGRGVRLKGHDWSLKRSSRLPDLQPPPVIRELETINVFGIDADFMEVFSQYLEAEGLPGNERMETVRIPMNVTYDFGKRLKVLRPKNKTGEDRRVSFSKDGPTVRFGEIPDLLHANKIRSDWYPRIKVIQSRSEGQEVKEDDKDRHLSDLHLAWLDRDALYLELERYKRDRGRYNINITHAGIDEVLRSTDWYTLKIPEARLKASTMADVRLWQQIALELLKRYMDRVYMHASDAFYLPRLEYRDLEEGDEALPLPDSEYLLQVDSSEEILIQQIEQLKQEIADNREDLVRPDQLRTICFPNHLYQPLFHAQKGGRIKITPVALNESEYTFVRHLEQYCTEQAGELKEQGMELFLLRNQSRGRSVGFFEARNFHPDFILWILKDGKQYVTFVEPHGLLHGSGPGDPKVQFHKTIKEIEERLHEQAQSIVLNSFILSWTKFAELNWGWSREEMKDNHVLMMQDLPEGGYVAEMVEMILDNAVVA